MVPITPDSPRKAHARGLFAGLAGAYDRAGAVLSFGQDPRWRHEMVTQIEAHEDQTVLDVASGTGLVAAQVRATYGCRVVALDQSPEMLARAEARFRDDCGVQLVVGEAERLPFADGSFDALTFTYLLRYVDDVPATLAELVRVLRPGGRMASLEFGVPPAAIPRAGWHAVTRTLLPLGSRLISREWGEVGAFLGPSIEEFNRRWSPARLAAAWHDAGMDVVCAERLTFGAGVVMWGTRAAERR